jgi:peptidoglycan/xylan/chitin deacetylase (PgdA/CDA1 family)
MVYAIDTPAVSIGLDHGFNSHEVAAQYMNDRGMTGSIFVVTQNFNRPAFMNVTTLLQLQDQNWEIVSHTNNHTRLVNVPQNVIDYEVIESKRIFEEMGFQIYGFTPPNVAWDNQSLDTMFETYNWVGFGLRNTGEPYDIATDTYKVNTVPVNLQAEVNDFQSAKLRIDEAISNDEILILTFHNLENLQNPFNFPMAEFLMIIDYLDEVNVPVVPISELYDLSNSNTPPILPQQQMPEDHTQELQEPQ